MQPCWSEKYLVDMLRRLKILQVALLQRVFDWLASLSKANLQKNLANFFCKNNIIYAVTVPICSWIEFNLIKVISDVTV